jgi:hypothetical protein
MKPHLLCSAAKLCQATPGSELLCRQTPSVSAVPPAIVSLEKHWAFAIAAHRNTVIQLL